MRNGLIDTRNANIIRTCMQLHNEPCNNPKIIIKTEGHVYVPDIRCSLLNSDFTKMISCLYYTQHFRPKDFLEANENFANS